MVLKVWMLGLTVNQFIWMFRTYQTRREQDCTWRIMVGYMGMDMIQSAIRRTSRGPGIKYGGWKIHDE